MTLYGFLNLSNATINPPETVAMLTSVMDAERVDHLFVAVNDDMDAENAGILRRFRNMPVTGLVVDAHSPAPLLRKLCVASGCLCLQGIDYRRLIPSFFGHVMNHNLPARVADLIPQDYASVVKPHMSKPFDVWAAHLQTVLSAETIQLLPHPSLFFACMDVLPFDQIKIVVLGQDPYPTPTDPHGLAFSSRSGTMPQSLRHIDAQLKAEGFPGCGTGNLTHWACQGVLLMNTALSVRAHAAGSMCQASLWHPLTKAIVRAVSSNRNRPIAFILWGRKAQDFKDCIQNQDIHWILETAHPSPLGHAANAPVPFHSRPHFTSANDFLIKNGSIPIKW